MLILGVQIDSPHLRTALLKKRGKGIEVVSLASTPLDQIEHVKPLYMKRGRKVVSGLSTSQTFVKSVELQVEKERHLEEILAFHSEASSSFDGQSVVTASLWKKRKGGGKALLFTTPREELSSHLQHLLEIEMEPERVSATPLALFRFVQWQFPSFQEGYLIDLGSSSTTLVAVEGGEIQRTYAIDQGIEGLFQALGEDRKKSLLPKEIEGFAKQLDLFQLKSHLSPHLFARLKEFSQELGKALFSFERGEKKKPILLMGRVDAFLHLESYLLREIASPESPKFEGKIPLELQKFGAAIGLALEEAATPSLQFLKGEFYPKKLWKKLGLYSVSLFFASLLLSGSLLEGGRRIEQRHKQERTELLLASLAEIDPPFAATLSEKSREPEEVLEAWSKAVATYHKPYPYILQVPSVGKVLHWLSSHPLFQSFEKEGDPLRLLDLHYQLVEVPKVGDLKKPYSAKVEIEFSIEDPLKARKIHEHLLKGDELVDEKKGISWDPLSHSYKASFYLKATRGKR